MCAHIFFFLSRARDEKIRANVLRVLGIWQDRSVYVVDFIDELKSLLVSGVSAAAAIPSPSKVVVSFKLPELTAPIDDVREMERKAKLTITQNTARLEVLNIALARLKDKTGEQYSKECDDAVAMLEQEIQTLEQEIAARNKLMAALDDAIIFYETQREETASLENAYNALHSRVLLVKKRLAESAKLFTAQPDSKFNSRANHGAAGSSGNMSKQQLEEHEATSSLDQRLSSLMSMVDSARLAGSGQAGASPLGRDLTLQTLQSMLQIPPGNVKGSPLSSSTFFSAMPSTASIPLPPQAPAVSGYEPQSRYSAAPSQSHFHQIQSVVSSRMDMSPVAGGAAPHGSQMQASINPYTGQLYPAHAAHENFEPADMDLGNSDDDNDQRGAAPYVPSSRPNTHNLKVIEPQHHRYGGGNARYDPSPPSHSHSQEAGGWQRHQHQYNPLDSAFLISNDYNNRKARPNQQHRMNNYRGRGNFPPR